LVCLKVEFDGETRSGLLYILASWQLLFTSELLTTYHTPTRETCIFSDPHISEWTVSGPLCG